MVYFPYTHQRHHTTSAHPKSEFNIFYEQFDAKRMNSDFSHFTLKRTKYLLIIFKLSH